MDFAREPADRVARHRPAAEPEPRRTAVAQAVDVRRAPIAQLAAAEEELQMKLGPGVAQRAAPEEELQMKSADQGAAAHRVEATPRAGGAAPLPAGLRAGLESLSGMSMADVNVHYGSGQPAQLNALAFARGTDIHLGPGQETHLPHEAWHVVQQAQGRVEATLQSHDGVPINDDPGLEREADDMGARARTLGG